MSNQTKISTEEAIAGCIAVSGIFIMIGGILLKDGLDDFNSGYGKDDFYNGILFLSTAAILIVVAIVVALKNRKKCTRK